MASTQNLTELPTIQYTGMDYSTVISQIKEIIENNSNWSQNWTQFYNSEAGTMLIQLMAWICDNLAVRQDILYNEQFLVTASSDASKLRLLNQIGYVQKTPSAAIVPISLEFNNINDQIVNISCCRENENYISDIQSNILNFYGLDINGNNVPYEILSVNSDGTINYTNPIKIAAGSAHYTLDTNGNQLTAVQGRTVYKEFSSQTSNGPVFVLSDTNIDLKTLVVYDITNNINIVHVKVDNFMDPKVLTSQSDDEDNLKVCYIVEKNDDGYFQIRYADSDLVKYGNTNLSNRLFKSGHTIGVLYRTTAGSDGNIPANYLTTSETFICEDGESQVTATITNILSGYNGEDGESLDSAVKNAPLSIMSMNRAVTINDYDRILKNSDLVLNCKSFSPENMPDAFVNYYGRRINPQEVFSFMVLNKNFNNCPVSKLNHFPWIELNKEPILNEQYVFGEADMNYPINYNGIYKNAYLTDNILSGNNYYSYTKNGNTYYARMLKNLAIFKTGSIFGDKINSDDTSDMKLKIHSEETNSLYIDDINGYLTDDSSITVENNICESESNAKYTALNSFDIVDCKNFKYIKFVLDDNLVVTVDLQKQMQEEIDIMDNKYSSSNYNCYYLKIDNTPTETFKSHYETLDKNAVRNYFISKDAANTRKGIIQLIKEAVNKYATYNLSNTVVDVNKLESLENNNFFKLYKENISDNIYVEIDGKHYEAYDGDTEEECNISKKDLMYKSVLSNKYTSFVDLGIQDEYETVNNVSDGKYLYKEYGYVDGIKRDNYNSDETKFLYTLKINNKIYAFRLDAYTVKLAFEHYKSLCEKENNNISYYDYFNYIGKGSIITSAKIEELLKNSSELSDATAEVYKTINMNFTRFPIKENAILENKIIKTEGENNTYSSSSSIEYIKFSIGSIATTLEYLISPFNTQKDTVYMFVPSINENGGTWIDIKDDSVDNSTLRLAVELNSVNKETGNSLWININDTDSNNIDTKFNNSSLWKNIFSSGKARFDEFDQDSFKTILNNKLRVRTIEKNNFDTNAVVRLSDENITNIYESKKEYDIRFEYINGENTLKISSVDEKEYSNSNGDKIDIVDSSENGNTTSYVCGDLIKELLGFENSYKASPVDYSDADSVVEYSDEKLSIKSLNSGENSSLYFIQTAKLDSNELIKKFGLVDGFCNTLVIDDKTLDYTDRACSTKAYGYRRVELCTNKNTTNIYSGVPSKHINEITDSEIESNLADDMLSTGDIIITSNDINYVDLENLYISYVLNSSTLLQINKNDNFYYSDDETTNEYAKPAIVGIEGEVVAKNDDDEYYIDTSKSRFGVKLTKNIVDTNSYYAINSNTYEELKSIENKQTKIETTTFDKISDYSKELKDFIVPIIMSMDDETNYLEEQGSEYIYDSDHAINITAGTIEKISGSSIYNALISAMKNSNNEMFNKNYHALVKKYYNTTNKICLSGLSNNGCIEFYYPDSNTITNIIGTGYDYNNDSFKAAFKLLYKSMFGTNKTNPDFYNLYPIDAMEKIGNSGDIIQYIDDDKTEYYYCPVSKHHLRFEYRCFIDDKKTTSKFGDYYISASGSSFKDGYNFFINKTKYSTFPDCKFYLHFVNDRTYEYKRTNEGYKTEQDSITEYMKNYKITGTELHFLKPYFKPFDIKAIVNYNANYDLSTIKSNVENALTDKYRISNLSDISVGNKIYRSDIFKTILNVDGVESAQIEYFGYDYTNQTICPDKKYLLSSDNNINSTDASEFYIISVLNDNDDFSKHGLIIDYAKSDAVALDV